MYHRGVDHWATEHRYHDTPALKAEEVEKDFTHFEAHPEGEPVMHYDFRDRHAHGIEHHRMPHFTDADLHHEYPMKMESGAYVEYVPVYHVPDAQNPSQPDHLYATYLPGMDQK